MLADYRRGRISQAHHQYGAGENPFIFRYKRGQYNADREHDFPIGFTLDFKKRFPDVISAGSREKY